MKTTVQPRSNPSSRRALLAGAVGGLAAWAASAIGRADPAQAAAGDPIRMGRLNLASSTATTLQTKTSRAAYLVNQLGVGAAVKGVATSGRAIIGEAGSQGTGVWAYSPDHSAVSAICPGGEGQAVSAESQNGVGVLAYGGTVGVNAITDLGGVGLRASGETAAEFIGPVVLNGYQDVQLRQETPPAPPGSYVRLFGRDTGPGKSELCVMFGNGEVFVIATES
jgi:hypothetical protein